MDHRIPVQHKLVNDVYALIVLKEDNNNNNNNPGRQESLACQGQQALWYINSGLIRITCTVTDHFYSGYQC